MRNICKINDYLQKGKFLRTHDWRHLMKKMVLWRLWKVFQSNPWLSLSCIRRKGWEYFIANLTTDGLQCLRVSSAIVVTGEKYHVLPLPLTTGSPISLSLCSIVCCRGSPLPLPSRGAPLSLSLMWEGWEYFIANLTMDGLQCLRVSGAIVVTGEKYHILPLPLTTWSPISLSLCFIVCCRGSPLPLPLPSRGAPLSLSLSHVGFTIRDLNTWTLTVLSVDRCDIYWILLCVLNANEYLWYKFQLFHFF